MQYYDIFKSTSYSSPFNVVSQLITNIYPPQTLFKNNNTDRMILSKLENTQGSGILCHKTTEFVLFVNIELRFVREHMLYNSDDL